MKDHCHFTSKYRGAAHQDCNINYEDSCTIPILFHNLSSYDAHFFLKKLQNQFPGKIDLLAITRENYIFFTKHVDGSKHGIKLRFIDSFRFLASSLDSLSIEIPNNEKIITRSLCKNEDQFKLITKKGCFPYEYLDDWEKFNETELPSKEKFFSQLNNEHISDDSYNHARNVWDTFNIQNLGKYSDYI